jgi:hypothetical protein
LAWTGNEFHGMFICFLLGLQLETGRRVMFVCHIVDGIALMTHNRYISNNQCIWGMGFRLHGYDIRNCSSRPSLK